MRKRTKRVLGAVVVIGAVGVAMGAAKSADAMGVTTCNTSWTQNSDETTRKPVQKDDGMEFSGSNLIHHTTSLDVKDLTPGTYSASPTPDQPSFFSVEVFGTDGGYATLRWDKGIDKWTMVTGGQLYSDTSPAALVDQPTSHKSHHVVSFGVGYTANPPGTVTTLVSSVKFQGKTYSLACPTEPTPKPSDSVTPIPSTPTTTPPVSGPPVVAVPPGEAPRPIPVTGDLPVTG